MRMMNLNTVSIAILAMGRKKLNLIKKERRKTGIGKSQFIVG